MLDFRAGVLTRRAEWVSPVGGSVRVTSTRLVSFPHRALAAVCYEVEPLGGRQQLSVQSELLANEQLPPPSGDPRASMALDHPLMAEYQASDGHAAALVHRTQRSGLRVAAAMDHLIDGPASLLTEAHVHEDIGLVTASAALEPGQRLRLIKFVAYGWSSRRSLEGVRDQVWAELISAKQIGWDGLVADQRAYLDEFWDRADVQIDGDAEIQQAVRFGLFHVVQAAARGEERPDPGERPYRTRL